VQQQLEQVLQWHQQQQQQQQSDDCVLDQQAEAALQAAAVSWWQLQQQSSQQYSPEQLQQLVQQLQHDSLVAASPEQLAEQLSQASAPPVKSSQVEQLWQLPQWQVVQCCASQVGQLQSSTQLADVAVSSGVIEAGRNSSSSSSSSASSADAAGGSSSETSNTICSRPHSSIQQQSTKQPADPAAARQPEPLYRLVMSAKRRQRLPPHQLQLLLDQLQPPLLHLLPEHLAHAAWAAAQLAEQHQPSQAWLSTLLEAASSCFTRNIASSSSSSSKLSPASTATLLQALVKLQQQPSPAWLSACCSSMQLEQWTCPRALSTVAACLPQLGCVPDEDWAQRFYVASAAALPAFPGISLARMLHGVTAWRHLLQQQQQQQRQYADSAGSSLGWNIPEPWLLAVLASLNQHSSQLKPAELSMVLQSLQRLQQQQHVLPAAGRQPSTQLQQSGQQLLHSLMAAVLQQLPSFGAKDFTVMLFAVAALHEQPQQQQQQQPAQQGVTWLWLLRVLKGVEVRLMWLPWHVACLISALLFCGLMYVHAIWLLLTAIHRCVRIYVCMSFTMRAVLLCCRRACPSWTPGRKQPACLQQQR
jgi:hypothetical protein